MLTYRQLIGENTFYQNEVEKHDFIQDDSGLMLALIYNFFGNIAIIDVTENQIPIKQYFKSDKSVRLNKIGDENNNSSLSVKLCDDAKFFRTDKHVQNMTRFLAKLKTGKVDSIDGLALSEMLVFTPKGNKALKANPKIKSIVDGLTTLSLISPDEALKTFVGDLKDMMMKQDDKIVGDFKKNIKKAKLPKTANEKANEWTLEDYESSWVAGIDRQMDEIKNDWNNARNDYDSINKFEEFQAIFLDGDSRSVGIKDVKELTAQELSEYFDKQPLNDLVDEITDKRDPTIKRNIHKLIIDGIGLSKWNKKFWMGVFKSYVDNDLKDNHFGMLVKFAGKIKEYYPDFLKDVIDETDVEDFSYIYDFFGDFRWKMTSEESLMIDKRLLDKAIDYYKNGSTGKANNFFFTEILRQPNRPAILNNNLSLNKEYAKKIVDNVPDEMKQPFFHELSRMVMGNFFKSDGSDNSGKKLISEIIKLNPDEFADSMTPNLPTEELSNMTKMLNADTVEKLIIPLMNKLKPMANQTNDEKNIKIVTTLLYKKMMENGKYQEVFVKYFPNASNDEKNLMLKELLINLEPNVNVEKANETKMNILLNDYDSTINSNDPNFKQAMLMMGVFDYITPSQNNELLRQVNDGDWWYFDKMGILSDSLQDRMNQTNYKMLSDSLETQPDEVNDYYDNGSKGDRQKINNYFQGWNLLSNQIKGGVIPSFTGNVSKYDLKNMLDYNNLDYQEVYKKSKTQKRKNENLTDYITRIDRFLKEGKLGLAEPKVTPIDETPEELKEKSIQIQNETRNENHGPNHLKILKTYQVNFPITEYEKFVEVMKMMNTHNPLIPAFTGTSGIGANMIMRYGFALLPNDAQGVTGKALGQGIYLAKNIDKVQQYLGETYNVGARKVGTKGYILQMEAELGENGVNFEEAGTGSDNDLHPNFISPEWAVKDPEKQIKMMKLLQVELISLQDWKEMNNLNENMNFSQFLTEDTKTVNNNQVTFTIHDNHVFMPNGKIKEFEEINHSHLPDNMKIVKERNYCKVIFTKVNKSVYFDTRWCSSMDTNTKRHYFRLMNR